MSLLPDLIRQYQGGLARHNELISQHKLDISDRTDQRGADHHNELIAHHDVEATHLKRVIGLLWAGLTKAEQKEIGEATAEVSPVTPTPKKPSKVKEK